MWGVNGCRLALMAYPDRPKKSGTVRILWTIVLVAGLEREIEMANRSARRYGGGNMVVAHIWTKNEGDRKERRGVIPNQGGLSTD